MRTPRSQAVFILTLGALMVLGRFAVPGHGASAAGSYEAMSHIFCGVLIGLLMPKLHYSLRTVTLWVLISSGAFELVMFLNR